ncbi:MAG: hypothetical protein ACREM3_13420 [Candidatus Rokuibacteriota bacterium]
MLVRRCAWHRRYHGYPLVYGVASWRGERLDFTDGLCHACAVRARDEMGIPGPGPSVGPRRVLALVAALTFLLAPEVLDQFPPGNFDLPSVLRPATLVPRALAIREAAADEPVPALDVASVLALVTAAASAIDGPIAGPPPTQPAMRHPPEPARALSPLPTRSQLRLYDDPTSPFAPYSIQVP